MPIAITNSITAVTVTVGFPVKASEINNLISNDAILNPMLGNFGEIYINGFNYGNAVGTTTFSSSVFIQPGICGNDATASGFNPGAFAMANSLTMTCNLLTVSANGLDAGAKTSNTMYSLWVIAATQTIATLASTDATNPTLPAGFLFRRRIGWFAVDAAANIASFLQMGLSNERYVHYDSAIQIFTTITSAIVRTELSQGVANTFPRAIPPGNTRRLVNCTFLLSGIAQQSLLFPEQTSDDNNNRSFLSSLTTVRFPIDVLWKASATVDYRTDTAQSITVWVNGFWDLI